MGYYPISKPWRPDVGSEEHGVRKWKEYYVDVEYIAHIPGKPKEQYYMRAYQWLTTMDEVKEYLSSFDYGPIRQAWITEVETIKTRTQYYEFPHNISDNNL